MNASGNLISYPKENKVTKAGSVKIPKLNVPAEFAEKTETENNLTLHNFENSNTIVLSPLQGRYCPVQQLSLQRTEQGPRGMCVQF